jgi:hypothetical protein
MQHESVHISLQNTGQGSAKISNPSGMMGGGQSVPLSIPLPFLLTGSVAAVCFALLLPWTITEALLAPGFPHVLTLVHIVTLGWLTMSIMGASLQLVPVIIAAPLRATRFLRWQYPLYSSGVLLLLCGFWWMLPWLMISGGTLVVLAVLYYITVLSITLASTKTRSLTVCFLATSLTYLAIVVSLGLTAALDFQFQFLTTGFDRLLLTHITLGVVGWLTSILIGVSYKLVGMFALSHGHNDRVGHIVFWLLNGGVIGLACGFSLAWTELLIIGGLLLIAAVWLFGYDYVQILRTRHRKLLDVTQYHALASVAYLVIVVPVGVAATLLGWQQTAVLVSLALATLVGWLGQSIMGYLYKIVPFLVWQQQYGPLVGKQKVPLMREMIHERLAWIGWWLVNGGLIMLILASLLHAELWIMQIASVILAGGCLLAMFNIFSVVRHLWQRQG